MKRIPLKPLSIVLFAAAVLSAIAIMLVSGKSVAVDGKGGPGPKPALTVTTIKPSQANVPVRMTANGNIAAWQEAIIGSESNGLRLTDVRVNVGDTVRAGQVLATFADESVKADVAQARAAAAVCLHSWFRPLRSLHLPFYCRLG